MKMRNGKKILSILLVFVLFASVISTDALEIFANTASEEGVTAEYNMSLIGNKLRDISGNENHAELSDNVSADAFKGNLWKVNGSDTVQQYAKLPIGIIEDENFTIQIRTKSEQPADQFTWVLGTQDGVWASDSSTNPYNFIFMTDNNRSGKVHGGISRVRGTEYNYSGLPSTDLKQYHTITVTSDGQALRVYIDGEYSTSLQHHLDVNAILQEAANNGGDHIGYIGKSVYVGDGGYKGTISNFKVFNYTLDANEVSAEHTALLTDLESIMEAVTSDVIPNQDDIRGNISLPDEYEGAQLTWSSDSDLITTEPTAIAESHNVSGVEAYTKVPAGMVTRPASGDETVTLTVTGKLTADGPEISKDIILTIKQASGITEDDYTAYLFSYFSGEGYRDGEQIFLATSKDGLNWKDLNNNNPVLESSMGERGLRDPYLIRSPEGDKFYMIATDLRIYNGNGWTAAQQNGSQCIMVWESTDLVNWSDQRMIQVAREDAGCTWAPECFYDEITGEYIVYWASKIAEDGYSRHKVYYAKTRDFFTFTEPEVMIDWDSSVTDYTKATGAVSVIDTTIVKHEGTYYRYSKNESDYNNNNLTGKNILIETGTSLLGDYNFLESEILSSSSHRYTEGPTIFKFNGEDKWCLLLDNYGGGGYYPLITDDLASGSFETLNWQEYKMPSRARHGTPISLTEEEYNNLMDAYYIPEEIEVVHPVIAGTSVEDLELPDIIKDAEGFSMNVEWDLSGLSDSDLETAYDTVTIPYTSLEVVNPDEKTTFHDLQTAVLLIELIPDNLIYFIDSNGSAEPIITNQSDLLRTPSPVYTAINEFVEGGLKNETADKAYDSSTEGDWGVWEKTGNLGVKSIASGTYNKTTSTGWYASNNDTRTLGYTLQLEAGVYEITSAHTEWWNGRNLTTSITYNDENGEQVTETAAEAINISYNNASVPRSATASYAFTLPVDSEVIFTVDRVGNTGEATVISWLAVAKLSDIEREGTLTAINIKEPDKIIYEVDEALNLEGMAVTAVYSDNTTKLVTDYTVSKFDSSVPGLKVITVSYTEDGITVSETFTVTVNEPVEVPEPDKSELKRLYDEYILLTQGNYTDDSWAVFVLALTKANEILNTENATVEQIETASERLENAYKGLKDNSIETDESDTNESDTQDSNDTDESDTQNSSDTDESDTQASSDTDESDTQASSDTNESDTQASSDTDESDTQDSSDTDESDTQASSDTDESDTQASSDTDESNSQESNNTDEPEDTNESDNIGESNSSTSGETDNSSQGGKSGSGKSPKTGDTASLYTISLIMLLNLFGLILLLYKRKRL